MICLLIILFYVITMFQASSSSEILSSDERDSWVTWFPTGADVIRGLYFTKESADNMTYRLVKRKSAIVPASSVIYACSGISLTKNFFFNE